MNRCSGTPTTRANCPRVGLAPLRSRSLQLNRTPQRAVVRSYPEAALRRTSI